jgi:hypothetical protein
MLLLFFLGHKELVDALLLYLYIPFVLMLSAGALIHMVRGAK